MARRIMTTSQTDYCIRRTAEGDRAAFAELYEGYKDHVYRFALSIVKNAHMAEDVLQDAFVSIFSYARSYRAGSKPEAWIFTIVRNLCRRQLSSPEREHLDVADHEESVSVSDTDTALVEDFEALEALQVLTDEEREVVSLYVFGGLRQTEIAHTLGITYVSVRSRYAYAIRKLKGFYTRSDAAHTA